MAKKSILAEMQRQIRASQREAERRQRQSVREHEAAVREAERARKAEERALAQAARAEEAERKRLEKEAKAAHVEAKLAEVVKLNAQLAETYDEIDGLLKATLEVDDFVDLDELRRTVEHPPFDRSDLEVPIPPPREIPEPPKPEFVAPEAPKGILGRKKKAAEAAAAAQEQYERSLEKWQVEVEALPGLRTKAADEHAAAEANRIEELNTERARYERERSEREAEVAQHNESIDALVANLGYGTAEAIQEYVSIVLSNSVYPDHFDVQHEFEFEPSTAELQLKTLVPGPSTVPTIKTYKYTKTTDEISSTAQSQKASKDRYRGAVEQVALRTLHEVFEADRRGLIKAISLELGTETIIPATGKQGYFPFVAVAAARDVFMDFDLSAVLPSATLQHLGASVSKNPFDLVAANTSGIRKS